VVPAAQSVPAVYGRLSAPPRGVIGELIVLHHLPHAGVILLRLGSEQLTAKTEAMTRLTDHGVRVRRAA
jgi:hypothetical protein